MYQRTKEMIKDYKADMPLKEMVKKYNILANSIIQTMSRAGVKRPKEKFCRNHPDRPTYKDRRLCEECAKEYHRLRHKKWHSDSYKPKTKKEIIKEPLTDPILIKLRDKYRGDRTNESGKNIYNGTVIPEITVKPKYKRYYTPY